MTVTSSRPTSDSHPSLRSNSDAGHSRKQFSGNSCQKRDAHRALCINIHARKMCQDQTHTGTRSDNARGNLRRNNHESESVNANRPMLALTWQAPIDYLLTVLHPQLVCSPCSTEPFRRCKFDSLLLSPAQLSFRCSACPESLSMC